MSALPVRHQCGLCAVAQERLNDAMLRGREGLLLKNVDSPYVLALRGQDWLKFKPDRVEGMHDSFDLLLLGGYYGEGTRSARAGDVSHFLLGVVEKVDPGSGERPQSVYAFCKVGSGYKDAELQELRERMQPHWTPYNARASYPWLMGWKGEAGDVPDVVIRPELSMLMEVKVYEIIPCRKAKFHAEFTCRFPRVVRWRWDKEWYEAMDIDRLRDLAKEDRVRGAEQRNAQGPLTTHAAEVDIEDGWGLAGGGGGGGGGGTAGGVGGKRKKRGARAADSAKPRVGGAVLSLFQATDLSHVQRRSSLLEGAVLCVMTTAASGPQSKVALERLIAEHGGGVSQHPLEQPSFLCILADDSASMRVAHHIRKRRFDVLSPQWLLDSVAAGRQLPWTASSRYVFSATAATLTRQRQEVDEWGDSLDKDLASVDELRHLIAEVRGSGRAPSHPFVAALRADAEEPPSRPPPPLLPPVPAAANPPAGIARLRHALDADEKRALDEATRAVDGVDEEHVFHGLTVGVTDAVRRSGDERCALSQLLLRLYGAALVQLPPWSEARSADGLHAPHLTHVLMSLDGVDDRRVQAEADGNEVAEFEEERRRWTLEEGAAPITAEWVIAHATQALKERGG